MTGPISRTRRRGTLVALAAMSLLVLALASPASAAGAIINVSPAGNDANPGTAAAPLKTLTKALSKAVAGDTVKLGGGGYGTTPQGFGSGETFPAGGLAVPSGVTIEGATDAGFPVSTLLGQGSGVALNLKGDATVRNLAFGFQGFGVGIVARQGTQTLSNLFIPVFAANVGNVDGVPFSAAIVLRGSARTTLNAGAQQSNTIGTTIIVNSGTGVSVNEQAHFTMDGGTITGGDQPNCRTNANGIDLTGSAQATLRKMVPPGGVRNIAGIGLRMGDTTKALVSESLWTRNLPDGCQAAPSVLVSRSAGLTFDHVVSDSIGGGGAVQIQTTNETGLAITLKNNSTIVTDIGTALNLRGAATVTVDQSSVASNRGTAIDAGDAALTVTRSRVDSGNDTGDAGIRASKLKLRDSFLKNGRTRIVVTGAGVDLGNLGDPGNNDLSNIGVGPAVQVNVTGVLVRAVGNIWNPNTQGSDANGRYPKPLTVTGLSPLARGRNFELPSNTSNVAIDIGSPTTVGTFSLSPSALRATAGGAVPLTVSWTHPTSWRQLKNVQLRLVRGGTPVGQVAFDVRSRTLKASGAAQLARLKSFSRAGKDVKVAFALRIATPGSYALQLAATDKSGKRQTFASAGSLRVVR